MIPKKIHYCWVGGNELSDLAQKCIASWEKYCPDYEIIRWDESNYDFHKQKYMDEAYQAKVWGFVPDYARLDIIYNHGGIYLDTDVEIIKPLDPLLEEKAFAGFESEGTVALGLGFGAEPHHPLIAEMRDFYDGLSFYGEDGSLNLTPSPLFQTEVLKKHHLEARDEKQILEGNFTVFPKAVFNPCDLKKRKIHISDETYSIHHYAGSWVTAGERRHIRIYQGMHRLLGNRIADKIYDWYKAK